MMIKLSADGSENKDFRSNQRASYLLLFLRALTSYVALLITIVASLFLTTKGQMKIKEIPDDSLLR